MYVNFHSSMLYLNLAELCMLPPDKGNCTEELVKYFFSPEAQKCFMFMYGGCEGNDNRFNDNFSCMRICTGNYTDEDAWKEVHNFMSIDDDGTGTQNSS